MNTVMLAEVTGLSKTSLYKLCVNNNIGTRSKLRVESGQYESISELTNTDVFVLISLLRLKDKAKVINTLYERSVNNDILLVLQDFDFHCEKKDMFVYFAIETETKRVKIGISSDPLSRVKQIDAANSGGVELVFYYKASKNGYLSETTAHKELVDYRVKGEWFDFSQKKAPIK